MDANPEDVGFHVIGVQFGGATEGMNLIPASPFSNNPIYESFENALAAIKADNPALLIEHEAVARYANKVTDRAITLEVRVWIDDQLVVYADGNFVPSSSGSTSIVVDL